MTGFADWERAAQRVVGKDANDIAHAIQDEVTRVVIDVEKKLCAILGREWRASGMSIETLLDEIRAKL
jgi:rRNA processing protein Krr1/Pno1